MDLNFYSLSSKIILFIAVRELELLRLAQLLFAPHYRVQMAILIRPEQCPVRFARPYCSLASVRRRLLESLARQLQVKQEQVPLGLEQVIAQPNFHPYPTVLLAKQKETHRGCLAMAWRLERLP